MNRKPTVVIPARLTDDDVKVLDRAVNLQKAANAFTKQAWLKESRSSIIRRGIYAIALRLQAEADEKDKKGSQRRYSERKKAKAKK